MNVIDMLSDSTLREIETRPIVLEMGLPRGERVLLTRTERDALCATVRALRAADEHHYQLWFELKERHAHKFEAGKWPDGAADRFCKQCGVSQSEDHAGYDCIAWLQRRFNELQSQLAQVTQERDEYRERLLKATETEVEI